MNPQSLIAFSPFLAVLYVVYAFIQALRHKRQGVGAALLGFIAVAPPLAALVLVQDATIRSEMLVNLTLSAIIVFVVGFITLMIERRNRDRDTGRSYGILGITLGVIFAITTFIYPLLVPQSVSAGTGNAAALNNGGLQNVSQTVVDSAETTAFMDTLTAQTGLTATDLTTKVEGGSTIASLISANNGDLNAAISATATTLDAMAAQGGFPSQMLANLGSDTTAVATQFVNGELDQRGQRLLTGLLVTGQASSFGGGGQFPAGGGNGFGGGNFGSGAGAGTGAPAARGESTQVAIQPTAQPTEVSATVTPISPTVRPTLITFPTAILTPIETEAISAGTDTTVPDGQASSSQNPTCSILLNYNLNLRDKPNTNDSSVYLSIPFGTSMTADGRTRDDWYSVTYEGQAGWVNGDYVTMDSTCNNLYIVSD